MAPRPSLMEPARAFSLWVAVEHRRILPATNRSDRFPIHELALASSQV